MAKLFQQALASLNTTTYRGWHIINAKQSAYFINDNFRATDAPHYCPIVSRWFGEIVPIVEMEILRRSMAFYRSRPSNWSFNIQAQRFANAKLRADGTPILPLDRVVHLSEKKNS